MEFGGNAGGLMAERSNMFGRLASKRRSEVSMPDRSSEMQTLKKEMADVAAFVKDKVEPVQDERVRLREAVEKLTAEQRDLKRSSLLNGGASDGRRIVESGAYAGCDVLDLGIAKSIQRAAATRSGSEQVREWDIRLKAAMDSVTAGTGDELVPTGMAARLWDDVHLETRVAGLFSHIEMPTNPFDIPLQLGDVNWYPGSENTATTNTAPGTAKQTMTAYELVAEVPWSLTLEEDAVIAMLPEVRRTLVRNAAEVIDDVLLNADTTKANNINADGATLATNTAGKAHWLVGFDGLIHLPQVDNSSQSLDQSGSISAAAYLKLLKLLEKHGVNRNESVFITDASTFLNSLGLTEVETVDKLGPSATILTGQLGAVYGHPLIVSGQVALADEDGKVTSGGNTTDTGRVLAVNTSQWRVGFRRRLMIETERDIQKRQNVMVVSMRIAFAERTGTRSSATHTALAYNVTV